MSNPIFPPRIEAADPHLLLWQNRLYLYATQAGKTERGFSVWSSDDAQNWKNEGMALCLANVSWAEKDDWGPAIIEKNGRFFLYFCADSQIGVAVADSPVGPFIQPKNAPLVPFRDDNSAIDPCAFTDRYGQSYLYFGAVPAFWLSPEETEINTALSVRPLAPDMVSFCGDEIPTIEYEPFSGIKNQFGQGKGHSLDHIEASFAFERDGIYYLMWSRGNHGSADLEHAYRVRYATAPSPLGPWTIAPQPVLQSRPEIGCIGPGHHALVQLSGDRWLCAYHAHDGDGFRRVWLDWMHFGPKGEILPIIPTREGVGKVNI